MSYFIPIIQDILPPFSLNDSFNESVCFRSFDRLCLQDNSKFIPYAKQIQDCKFYIYSEENEGRKEMLSSNKHNIIITPDSITFNHESRIDCESVEEIFCVMRFFIINATEKSKDEEAIIRTCDFFRIPTPRWLLIKHLKGILQDIKQGFARQKLAKEIKDMEPSEAWRTFIDSDLSLIDFE